MIMKCRDMERIMAESSQKLLHGGMRSRDWFSDKLEKGKKKGIKRINGLSFQNVCIIIHFLKYVIVFFVQCITC